VLDGVDPAVRGFDDFVEDGECGLGFSEGNEVTRGEMMGQQQSSAVFEGGEETRDLGADERPTCSEASSTSVPTALT